MEKSVVYQNQNTYHSLNEITDRTKYVWLVFHGLGYLSKYFIEHFKHLDTNKHYIICPQAPSKYYANKEYSKVGACWLTKENTAIETDNILNYIDSIIAKEHIPKNCEFIVLGYSQGVSIAARWLARRKHYCDRLVLISGKFPYEITTQNIKHLEATKTYITIGENDPLITPEIALQEINKLISLFPNIKKVNHDGGHRIDVTLFNSYLK